MDEESGTRKRIDIRCIQLPNISKISVVEGQREGVDQNPDA